MTPLGPADDVCWSTRHHSHKLCNDGKKHEEKENDDVSSSAHINLLSPSKFTRPSPLRSTSWRISLISLLVTCSPISFFMASLNSVRLIWPSPLESNWTQRTEKDSTCRSDKPWKEHRQLQDRVQPSMQARARFLTSLNASLSSLTPIMSAVSASSFGPISSTKSSKSTLPPPAAPKCPISPCSVLYELTFCLTSLHRESGLTDLLAQFDELHFRRHVSHGPHTLPQVFVTDVAFVVPVKLHKSLTEL